MKHFKILTILALGILASSSGMIQVGAVDYFFSEDFSTKEVVNFNNFKQTFSEDTINLDLKVELRWGGSYRFDSCPTAFTLNASWLLAGKINGSGFPITFQNNPLPDLVCTTNNTAYTVFATAFLPSNILDLIVDDDLQFMQFESGIILSGSSLSNGRTLTINNFSTRFDIFYEFNTTYLFNYFLSDINFHGRFTVGSFTFTGTQINKLVYVYTTAGNDTYYINNSGPGLPGTTRKKYAVNSDDRFFRGNSVGAGFQSSISQIDIALTTTNSILSNNYNYYYLNTANLAQAIVDAPLINFTEESCSGGFLDINVACYVNNAIAYLVNDAPVISDAFTLLNTGIELAAQTFGIIGSFSDDNVFGYLILVGFGFIAVKWFLKNDE
jgi:hypothetical protein